MSDLHASCDLEPVAAIPSGPTVRLGCARAGDPRAQERPTPVLRWGSALVSAGILGLVLAWAWLTWTGLPVGSPDARPARSDGWARDSAIAPVPELAREWVWEREAIRFDHMFRRKPDAW